MKRSGPPIALSIVFGVLAVAATLAVLVGWNIIFTRHYLALAASRTAENPGAGYWILLSIGDVALVFAIITLISFLVRNVRSALTLHRQSTFIDSMSHELRSPLAGLRLAVEALARHELDGATRARFVGNMARDIERLERFIEHALRAGRIEHGEQRLDVRPVELMPLLDQCVAQVADRYASRAPSLVVEVDGPDLRGARVRADNHALQIALLNLLDNAVKYSEDDPVVRVQVTARDDRVEVAVRDQGAGLSPATRRRIFDRFYRGEAPITRLVKGTGLGLHVSRELMRAMGGEIVADSEGLGKGSTFRLRLPLERST